MYVRSTTARRPSASTFEQFYALEHQRALQLAWLLTHDSATSEDIVQESFAAVWQRYDDIENPRAYLRTIIVNAVRKQARGGGRERRRAELYAAGAPTSTPPPNDPMVDLIAELSPNQRTVIVLRYWSDLPDSEIAEAIGLRPSSVRSLAHRALASLRKDIEP